MKNLLSIFGAVAIISGINGCQNINSISKIENKEKMENNTELTQQANGFINGVLTPQLNTPIVSIPDEYSLEYENVHFMTTDSVKISTWLIKGGTDKIIVQAHPVTANRSGMGSGDGKVEQLKTAKAFVDAGYSVLMFDVRNHGQSENGPVKYAVGSEDDAPDFIAALSFLSSHPIYKSSLVGIHAQCFGVNATVAAFGIDGGLRNFENLKSISLTQPASWGLLMRPQAGDAFVDEVNRILVSDGAKDLDGTPLKDAPQINVPTLVVQNQNDPSGTLPFVDEFFNAITTKKEKWMIDGAADRSYAYYHETIHPEKLVEWFNQTVK